MTSDAILVLRALFGMVWALFTDWYIPGTHTTPAGFFMFLLFASLGIRFMCSIFGMGGGIGAFIGRHSKSAGSSGGSGSGGRSGGK